MMPRNNLSLACILWVFPFFALPHTFFAAQQPPRENIREISAPEPSGEDAESSWGYFENSQDQKAFNYLNLQIQNLVNLRNYYEGKMARLRDRADYYQFQRGEYPLDSQSLLDRIEKYQAIVDRINNEIAILQGQRAELVKRQKPFPK